MIRSRLGLKVLGLCALALGLMAFVTSAAQAEELAHWNIIKANGELLKIELGATLLPQLEIKELENKTATLLFTTKPGTKVAILCGVAKFDEGGLLIAHGGVSLGRILFTECKVSLNGVLSPACKAHSTGKSDGEILTEKSKGLIVLDKLESGEVDDFVLIKPDEGTTLAKIEMGPECAIGELVKVEGELWIKDCGLTSSESNKSFLEEKVEHLIEESLHGLTALAVPATIDGSAIVKLTGEHAGLKWGGTPG